MATLARLASPRGVLFLSSTLVLRFPQLRTFRALRRKSPTLLVILFTDAKVVQWTNVGLDDAYVICVCVQFAIREPTQTRYPRWNRASAHEVRQLTRATPFRDRVPCETRRRRVVEINFAFPIVTTSREAILPLVVENARST